MDKDIKRYLIEVEKIVGIRIAHTRIMLGISRKELSEVINVSQQQLAKYEKGKNRISVGRLILVAKKLNKSLLHFLPDNNKYVC